MPGILALHIALRGCARAESEDIREKAVSIHPSFDASAAWLMAD